MPSGTPAKDSRSQAAFSSAVHSLRMVHVDAHPDRAVLPEDLAELGRDPLRQEHGDPRADPDELHVPDLAQPADDVLELLVGEQERVAAREQHVPDLGMRLDVAQALLVLRVEIVVLRVRDQPAARAVPAIRRAPVRHEEEHAVGIAVDEARHRRVRVLAQRVEHLLGADDHLLRAGDHLPADRAGRVAPVDQVEEVRRDRQRELLVREVASGLSPRA